jgi:hypothetical protein
VLVHPFGTRFLSFATLLVTVFGCGLVVGSPTVRMINRSGVRITSIFADATPNRKAAFELYRNLSINRAGTRPCPIRSAVYRKSESVARFINVQGGCRDVHYQVEVLRTCGSQCGGGDENWTYSNPNLAGYCDQYQVDRQGCNTGNCLEDSWCGGCF